MSVLLDLWPYLTALGLSILAVYKAFTYGKKSANDANRAKEADAYEQDLKELEAANRAGNRVRPDDGGVLADPRNRDRK